MPKTIKTNLYCFDDHRTFTEEIRKKFDDKQRYVIHSYSTRDDFISKLKLEHENNVCKIAIIGVHDSKEHYEMVEHLAVEIKKYDPNTGIIVICQPGKVEAATKTLKFNIDAFIPQNANSILRIHNAVKKLFSEHNIRIYRKRRNRSLAVLTAFVIFSILLWIMAYVRFPEFF